jgi:hypothetical protein
MVILEVDNEYEAIKKARPNLKDSSINIYVRNLNKLKKIFNENDYKFLENYEDVEKILENLSYLTVRNYYNAIIVLITALNGFDDELVDQYTVMRDELNEKYNKENTETNKISSKQEQNFITYNEVVDMLNKMADDLRILKIKQKKDIGVKERTLLQIFVIFNIYLHIPLRNDVVDLIKIQKREFNKLTDDDKKENNYIVFENNNMFFSIGKYKTDKTYSTKIIEIPKELQKVIRFWKRISVFNDSEYLFLSATGKKLTRNELSQLMIRFSKLYLNDKAQLSTTMMAKIVMSHHLGELKKKQEEMSKQRGTSINTINNIYIKEK